MSDSWQPHGLQHARPPCPLPTLGVYSNSFPLSRWYHPIISSSVVPFSCLQSFPALGSFPMSQFFTSGGQSIGVSASASVLPMSIQDWFSLGLTGWILQSKELSRVFSNTKFKSISSSVLSFLFSPPLTSILEKAMAPHSSTLAWKIPWVEEPGRLQSMGSLRIKHDWVTWLSLFTFMHWRRKWQPTPVFLPGESQGRWLLVGFRLWGHTESHMTEAT